MLTVSTKVTIGKSKVKILYVFLKSDFIRIEYNFLILKNDGRKLKIPSDLMDKLISDLNEL